MSFKIKILFLCFISSFVNAQELLPSVTNNTNSSLPASNLKFVYKIIETQNNTYGYNIYSDNQLFIHQTCIPGLSGNEGFKTSSAAEIVAKLVIAKMMLNEIPPSVTIEEMKNLKVIP